MGYHPPKKMFRISFTIENTKSDSIECNNCLKTFEKGEIQIIHEKVISNSDYFHLDCYEPKQKQFILIEDVKMNLDIDSKPIFFSWLDTWNAKYFPLDSRDYSPDFPLQQKLKVQVKNRRLFIEIFKFLDVFDLINSLSKVNKNFYTLTWENEIWELLLARDFNGFKAESSQSQLKKCYVACFNSICISCKKKPKDKNFSRCPMLKKTLCKKCLRLQKFALINKTQVLKTYGINSDLIKVGWWTFDGKSKVTYRYLFENGLMLFRNEQKAKVVEFLKSFCTNFMVTQFFESLDVSLMDLKIRDSGKGNIEIWKPDYQRIIRGSIFEKMFEFIRKGKELNFDKLIGNKDLIA